MSARRGGSLRTGSRVEYSYLAMNGSKRRVQGVIAYGPGSFHLKPNENDWCGVVLDEPCGKNNGTIQGKKYFDCPDGYGVFVRASTLRAPSSLPGISRDTPSPGSTPNLTPASSVSSISDLAKDQLPRESGNIPVARVSQSGARLKAPSKLQFPSSQNIAAAAGVSAPLASSGIARLSSGIPSALNTGLPQPSLAVSGLPAASAPKAKDNIKQMVEKLEQKVEEKIREVNDAEDISKISQPLSPTGQHDQSELPARTAKEMLELQDKCKDLESKLHTLMLKRAEDRAKFKDLERLRIQNEQLQENKRQMSEKVAELTKLKSTAEEQAKSAVEELIQQREEIRDLIDNAEMAVIDKEMAENKAEQLQIELESVKENLEEAKIDFELLKSEIEDKGADGAANSFQVKQLEEQTARYKEALLKLRDISINDRQTIQELQKDHESKSSELSTLLKEHKLKLQEIEKYRESVHELSEQVDMALGSQEMVEKLTEKNLELEDKNEELQKALDEEENLKDLNNMIIEEKDEMIADLRDEIDQFKTNYTNLKTNYLSSQEALNDHENTIRKFRELVSSLKEEITLLRASKVQDQEHVQQVVDVQKQLENIEFKTRLLDRKDFSRAIDMELRQLDVEQCYRYMVYLSRFFPESFFARGSDNDAIAVLLFFPRLLVKCSIVERQVAEKFNSGAKDSQSNEAIIQQFFGSGVQVDLIDQLQQRIFSRHIVYLLCSIRSILEKYQDMVSKCSVETYMKLASLFPELQSCEKDLDHYVDLLKQDKLDQSVSLDSLEKNLTYLQSLYNIHMAPSCDDTTQKQLPAPETNHNKFVNDLLEVVRTGMEASILDIKILSRMVTSDVAMFLTRIESTVNNIDQCCRKIRRRMVSAGSSEVNPVCLIRVPLSVEAELLDALYNLNKVLRFVKQVRGSLMLQFVQQIAQSKTDESSSDNVVYFSMDEVNKVTQDLIADDITALSEMLASIDTTFNKFSVVLQQGEFDVSKTGSDSESSSLTSSSAMSMQQFHSLSSIQTLFSSAQSINQNKCSLQAIYCSSLDDRALKWRAQSDQLDEFKTKILSSESEIAHLNRAMKIKMDEVSEMQIRRDIAEKKLSCSQSETKKIQDELERMKKEFKEKDSERERALNKFNQELNELYSDKKMMKEKLKEQASKNSGKPSLNLSLPLTSPNTSAMTSGANTTITGQQSMVSSMVSLNQSMTSSMMASVEIAEMQEQINNLRGSLTRMAQRNSTLRLALCDNDSLRQESWYRDNLRRFRNRLAEEDVQTKKENKLKELQEKLLQFKKDHYAAECAPPEIPNFDKIAKNTGWTKNLDSLLRTQESVAVLQRAELAKRYRDLQIEIDEFVKNFDDGFACDSTLASFVAPHITKMLDSKPQLVGRISIPKASANVDRSTIRVPNVTISQLCSTLLVA